MSLRTKFLGPKSKYDKSLPYTYTAKVQIIEEDPELVSTYFADTICGLVEYLDKQKISPKEVELFGIYRKEEINLDKSILLDSNGNWLLRPEICNSLEAHFEKTKDELYKGHRELEVCSFDDREREGEGPH